MKKVIITVIVLAFTLPGFVKAEGGHGKIKASHGGRILEVGSHGAHLEYVHDAKAGKITIYVLDKAGKKSMGIANAIKINVAGKNKKQLTTKAISLKAGKSSTFEIMDDSLKNAHLDGKIALKIDGKKYNVTIPHDHAH